MVGRLVSFRDPLFSGAKLVSGSASQERMWRNSTVPQDPRNQNKLTDSNRIAHRFMKRRKGLILTFDVCKNKFELSIVQPPSLHITQPMTYAKSPQYPYFFMPNFQHSIWYSCWWSHDHTICIICRTLFWLPSEAAMTRPLSATLTRSRVRSNATRDHGWTTTCKKIK